jgi:hypothetical protein
MFIGLIMLTAAWGVTQNGWVICYVWSLFFYGTPNRVHLHFRLLTLNLQESALVASTP